MGEWVILHLKRHVIYPCATTTNASTASTTTNTTTTNITHATTTPYELIKKVKKWTSVMETILSLDLLDFLSGRFLRSRVNPKPSAMRRVPSPALVELDPGHQVRGPGLVHRQAEAFVRHLLELGVLQPESANWRRISPDAAALPGWLHQRRRLQLERNDLGFIELGRI